MSVKRKTPSYAHSNAHVGSGCSTKPSDNIIFHIGAMKTSQEADNGNEIKDTQEKWHIHTYMHM